MLSSNSARVLRQAGDAPPDRVGGQVVVVGAAERDAAGLRRRQLQQQRGQRGLAGAGRAEQRDPRALRQVERQVLEDRRAVLGPGEAQRCGRTGRGPAASRDRRVGHRHGAVRGLEQPPRARRRRAPAPRRRAAGRPAPPPPRGSRNSARTTARRPPRPRRPRRARRACAAWVSTVPAAPPRAPDRARRRRAASMRRGGAAPRAARARPSPLAARMSSMRRQRLHRLGPQRAGGVGRCPSPRGRRRARSRTGRSSARASGRATIAASAGAMAPRSTAMASTTAAAAAIGHEGAEVEPVQRLHVGDQPAEQVARAGHAGTGGEPLREAAEEPGAGVGQCAEGRGMGRHALRPAEEGPEEDEGPQEDEQPAPAARDPVASPCPTPPPASASSATPARAEAQAVAAPKVSHSARGFQSPRTRARSRAALTWPPPGAAGPPGPPGVPAPWGSGRAAWRSDWR